MENLNLRSVVGYRKGIKYLIENTLPSQWSTTGLGWQEVWQESSYAGFYASCDGVVLLQQYTASGHVQKDDNEQVISHLVNNVWNNHIALMIDDNDDHSDQNRLHCQNINLKIVKFLTAAKQVSLNRRQQELVNYYHSNLRKDCIQNKGIWAHFRGAEARHSREQYLFPTIEAFMYFSKYHPEDSVLREGTEGILSEMLRTNLGNTEADLRPSVLILWAFTDIMMYRHECPVFPEMRSIQDESVSFLVSSFKFIIRKWEEGILSRNASYEKRFSHNVAGSDMKDYYSYNVDLLVALAAGNMLQLGLIEDSLYSKVLPLVEQIADSFNQAGYYKNDVDSTLYHWESCCALNVLYGASLVLEYIGNNNKSKGAFMVVNPTHFKRTSFIPEPDLVSVMMPFSPDWSQDVLQIFEKVCRKKGMRVWRADQDFTDDHIAQTIWDNINTSRFVIADCTGRNPNVFYELGLAHTIGKPVFMCAQSRDDFAFDIAAIRSFQYGTLPNQLKVLETTLGKFIDSL